MLISGFAKSSFIIAKQIYYFFKLSLVITYFFSNLIFIWAHLMQCNYWIILLTCRKLRLILFDILIERNFAAVTFNPFNGIFSLYKINWFLNRFLQIIYKVCIFVRKCLWFQKTTFQALLNIAILNLYCMLVFSQSCFLCSRFQYWNFKWVENALRWVSRLLSFHRILKNNYNFNRNIPINLIEMCFIKKEANLYN